MKRSRPHEVVDWADPALRRALDAAFHSRQDAFPEGSSLHTDLLAFLPRLATACSTPEALAAAAAKCCASMMPAAHSRHARDALASLSPALVTSYSHVLACFEAYCQQRAFARLLALAKAKATLPIAEFADDIGVSLRAHSVLVLAGDTGCGKSTQVPQFLLRAGYRRLAITQPRRLAAVALAARVAHETLGAHGAGVGHKVRFDASASAHTAVVFLTEGVLLRELASDPLLAAYDVVVLDEAHERHVSTDVLLGALKLLLLLRPALRLVVMSATIDVHRFAAFFGEGTPVLCVPGRLHPIRVEWRPPLDARGVPLRRPSNAEALALAAKSKGVPPRLDPLPYLRLLQSLDATVPPTERGDVLVFLPGAAEIAAVAAAVAPYAASSRRWIVLPLHASLPASQQAQVFEAAPPGLRKAVLATNVAETSVTIDGIRFVVDSGRAKLLRHDARAGGGQLREGWVSAAAAAQRAGRAGRTGPGVVFRLYSPEEHSALEAHTPPELLRAPLEPVLLQLAALCPSLGTETAAFPWFDAPAPAALAAAQAGLLAVGALDGAGRLTCLGSALAALPCDVAAGKLLLTARALGLPAAGAALAAALATDSPLARPAPGGGGAPPAARALRDGCIDACSDPLSAVYLLADWAAMRLRARDGDSRRWCRARALDETRLSELAKLQRLLSSAGQRRGHGSGGESSEEEAAAGARRALRAELRRLQRARGAAHGAGVLRLGEDGFALGSDEEADARDGGGDAARLSDLQLTLGADLGAAAAAAGACSGGLAKAMLLMAQHPSVALAAPGGGGELRLRTARDTVATLHPGSVLAARPGDDAAELVFCYSELLDTHRPFLLGVTALPAPALLLAAATVECDPAPLSALCDGWALLRFASAADGAAALAAAAALRAGLAARLGVLLGDATPQAPAAVAGLPEWASAIAASAVPVPAAAVLAESLAAFIARPVACTAAPVHNAASLAALRSPGALPVTGWLSVGLRAGGPCALAALAVTPHMRAFWACPACGAQLVATAAEVEAHRSGCSLAQAEEAGTRAWECGRCGPLRLTAPAWLRHRAACEGGP